MIFNPYLRFLSMTLALSAIALSCQNKQNSKPDEALSQEEMRERMIERNRSFLDEEKKWMEGFIAENEWQDSMLATGSGSYFMHDLAFPEKPRIQSQQEVTFLMSSYLLDGTPLFEDEEEEVTWKVDRTDGALGLHDILKKMAEGEQGRAILPSYQAYGLVGDLGEVPPRSPIYFELEILHVRTNN
jgi:FKBP-type peptidyl-prolyl cis-trans isomerase